MVELLQRSFARRAALLPLLLLLLLLLNLPSAGQLRAQTASPAQESAPKSEPTAPGPQAPATQAKEEVSSHDAPATFKVRVNLVLVRVVVRDAQGNVVGNLLKEDFQLFDRGKPQFIARFSVWRRFP